MQPDPFPLSPQPSLSQMPTQLVDSLSPEELLDLVAYLLSRGDANSPEFQPE